MRMQARSDSADPNSKYRTALDFGHKKVEVTCCYDLVPEVEGSGCESALPFHACPKSPSLQSHTAGGTSLAAEPC